MRLAWVHTGHMSDDDLPPEKAAGRPVSPWELDPDWQRAPKNLQKRRNVEAKPPPPVEKAVPRPQVAEPPPEPAPMPAAPLPTYVPMARRRQPLPEREGSWPALILLSMGLLLFVFVAWQYLHDEPKGADDDLRPMRAMDQTPVIRMPTPCS